MIKDFLIYITSIIRHFKTIYLITQTKKRKKPINLILGAASSKQNGWISTNKKTIDITKFESWIKYFDTNSIDKIMAEHVWEHLSHEDAINGLENLFRFIKIMGNIRIAVPDGFHPSKYYINHVKPGGIGPGAKEHLVLYNYKSIEKMLAKFKNNIKFEFLEFYDENNVIHTKPFNSEYGIIKRTYNNKIKLPENGYYYTSLIVDIKLISEFEGKKEKKMYQKNE